MSTTYTLKATSGYGDTLEMGGLTETTKNRYAAQLRDAGVEPVIAPEPAPYEDRFAEALAWLAVRFEERDGFLSDDDILDAVLHFTTSVVPGSGADPDAEWDRTDHDRLSEDLFAACTEETDR